MQISCLGNCSQDSQRTVSKKRDRSSPRLGQKIDNDMVKGVADAAAEQTELRISEIIKFM
jgi:hypothetical protein